MIRLHLFTAVLLLFLATAARAEEPLECRWAETPPVITGKGDDPIWQHAPPVANFRQAWLPGQPAAREGTVARLLWDREYLYFFAEMVDSDLSADVREHDGPMWENDVFELFLRPSLQHAGYFEFEVNPATAVLDAFFPDAESFRDRRHLRDGEFHVEAKVVLHGTLNQHGDRDQGWSVEGRIPWTDFTRAGGRPAPGETWRLNLSRVNGAEPAQELSSIAPLAEPSFHRTEEFLPLRFAGPEMTEHPLWENQRLTGSPDGPAKYRVVPTFQKLSARSVVAVIPTPDGEWIWEIEQEGGWERPMTVRRWCSCDDGADAETLLQLPDYIYSIAFHPHFAANGFVYLAVNGPAGLDPHRISRVLRYTVRDGHPDPASRTEIIEWSSAGHNGGGLAFASDGTLFLSSGDGSEDSDADNMGQNTASLRAKILHLDVDHPAEGRQYSIPRDNPFLGDSRFAPETWAYGLRNPWRLTFDAASQQLWTGENGQDAWESARLIQRGANYGWSAFEGSHPFLQGRALGPQPVTFPTVEFSHAEFRSLTGGVVYRGKQFPELVGAYVFGDFGTGRVWAAKHDGTKLEWLRELLHTPLALTHVSADGDGELLFADYGSPMYGNFINGGIYRLERAPEPATPPPPFPRQLSETGLFSDLPKLTPASGVLPYEINAPSWNDGAESVHHLALPGREPLEIRPQKSWQAPNGTALAQTLTLAGRRLETRVLVREQNDWAGYTYLWNAGQTDATLAEKGGADLELAAGQSWRVPSRAECLMCHSRQANFALTLHESQLNRGDQLVRWERLGLLRGDPYKFERDRTSVQKLPRPDATEAEQRPSATSPLLPRNPEHLLHYASTNDPSADLETRARSYLAVNCAHCHTAAGGGNSAMDFDWLRSREQMHAFEIPQHGTFGLPEARVIAPGAAARSVLISRISTRGPGQMPPLVSHLGDAVGVRLLVEWIQSLPSP